MTKANTDHVDLLTEWGEELIRDKAVPWNVYPRPQLVRESFLCLNGEWDFCVSETTSMPAPDSGWGTINLPFAPQSILSGVHFDIPDGSYLWYRRSIKIPKAFNKGRVLLHIDAADQITFAYVNGKFAGEHRGGYTRATFDITDALDPEKLEAEFVIRVYDRLADRIFPYGKQTLKRGGMWYTPVSGIWQSVWLESVPAEHVDNVKYRVTLRENGSCCVDFTIEGVNKGTLTLDEANISVPISSGAAHLELEQAHKWRPDDPYLYYFTVEAESGDVVRSYFAVRTVEIQELNGSPRVCINGEPTFFNGLLDQGYWSDGLLTPPSPECYAYEIESLKALGFNTLRKHIKVETDVFYYECDRLGMCVFQDMVNNGEYNFMRDTALPTIGKLGIDDTKINTDRSIRAEFEREMRQIVDHLKDHPSIVLWTIFNEGWGQFCGSEMYNKLREIDDTRLIDTASGWFAGCETDIESRHVYFRKVRKPARLTNKPFFVTEFGGYSWKPQGHCFNTRSTYAYGSYKTREDLAKAVRGLYEKQIQPLISKGLCGAIYTQVSDVEDETNGIFSFDRKVQKLLPEDML